MIYTAWIESHQALGGHPKTKKLARMLNISDATAVGHLHFLWWWSLDYTPEGSLKGFDACDIADAATWKGDPQQFIDALLQCGVGDKPGFLEHDENGDLKIHDWQDYVGKLLDKRRTDAERKKDIRKTSTGHPPDIQQTSDGQSTDGAGTVPTVPTVPKDIKDIKDPPISPKSLFGDYVLLTGDEWLKLLNRFGESQTKEMIEMLDNKIGENPKRKPYCDYASHYRVLLGWVLEEYKKRHPDNKAAPDNPMDTTDDKKTHYTAEDYEHLKKLRERQHGPIPRV